MWALRELTMSDYLNDDPVPDCRTWRLLYLASAADRFRADLLAWAEAELAKL
jgi:hypothetical protein